MGASPALALERLLESEGFARKPGGALLSGLGARLYRASELSSHAVERAALPTAVPVLDRLLDGGLPKGSLVELAGRRSSGRFSLGLAALAAATSTGQPAALVDLGDHLDPQSAELAGVDLERLLWARPRSAKEALAAAEMLVAVGFPLVVADLGLCPRTRWIPDAAWLRLSRAAQAQGSTLLLSTPWRASGIAAVAVVSAAGARPVWQGRGATPRLLAGLSSRLTLERLGRVTPGASAPLSLSAAEAFPGRPERGSESAPPPLLRDPRNSRKAVEPGVEAHDARNSLTLHDGEVQRVARGQSRVAQDDALGALDVGELDREDPLDDAEQRIESGLNGVAAADRDVTVQDLLQHLDVRDEPLSLAQGSLEKLLRVPLVRVRRADQVHRDIGVEEDHRGVASR